MLHTCCGLVRVESQKLDYEICYMLDSILQYRSIHAFIFAPLENRGDNNRRDSYSSYKESLKGPDSAGANSDTGLATESREEEIASEHRMDHYDQRLVLLL